MTVPDSPRDGRVRRSLIIESPGTPIDAGADKSRQLQDHRSPRQGIDRPVGDIALSQSTQLGLAPALFGVLSFVLAVLAELNKPPYGTPIQGRDVVVRRFPRDPAVALGALSALAAACSAALGALAVFFPYGGRCVPLKALLGHTTLYVFLHVAVGVTVAGVGTTVWATATEAMHHVRNVHRDLSKDYFDDHRGDGGAGPGIEEK
ncbi:hypothetical protein BAE44_0015765 [Dichanthelium oligosanthes]|uniref:Uncharacterized protein n=1 Tax=Dichanthelium oligosanthes TaxID=888268 RepID=A0A1E5VDJ3_9POAL|nr:hypothetical protein BAE44_0015765 [Dichanthelium oligosanthes]